MKNIYNVRIDLHIVATALSESATRILFKGTLPREPFRKTKELFA